MPHKQKHIKHVSHHAKHVYAPPMQEPAPVPTINALAEMQPFEQSAGAYLPPKPVTASMQPMAPQYDANAQTTANANADFADY